MARVEKPWPARRLEALTQWRGSYTWSACKLARLLVPSAVCWSTLYRSKVGDKRLERRPYLAAEDE